MAVEGPPAKRRKGGRKKAETAQDASNALTLTQMARDTGGSPSTHKEEDEWEGGLSEPGEGEEEEEDVLGVSDDEQQPGEREENEVSECKCTAATGYWLNFITQG